MTPRRGKLLSLAGSLLHYRKSKTAWSALVAACGCYWLGLVLYSSGAVVCCVVSATAFGYAEGTEVEEGEEGS